jgi:hypothetical protein
MAANGISGFSVDSVRRVPRAQINAASAIVFGLNLAMDEAAVAGGPFPGVVEATAHVAEAMEWIRAAVDEVEVADGPGLGVVDATAHVAEAMESIREAVDEVEATNGADGPYPGMVEATGHLAEATESICEDGTLADFSGDAQPEACQANPGG